MLRTARGTVALCAAVVIASAGASAAARAAGGSRCRDGRWRGWSRSFDLGDPSDAAIDGYNALLWAGGAAAVHWGADVPNTPRWSDRNDFDDEIRDGLRLGSHSGRSSARIASHVLLGASISAPLLAVGRTWLGEGDCDQALELATRFAESLTLTFLVTEATKVIAARERPHGSGSQSRQSFFSGHASIAATGAGLLCSYSLERRVWGDAMRERVLPCALGAGAALATGLMRIAGDEHWATDVIAGWTTGALIGWFDLPGPFDLLRFRVRGRDGRTAARGIVLPYAAAGAGGVRLAMHF